MFWTIPYIQKIYSFFNTSFVLSVIQNFDECGYYQYIIVTIEVWKNL